MNIEGIRAAAGYGAALAHEDVFLSTPVPLEGRLDENVLRRAGDLLVDEGHDLMNLQGTLIRRHELESTDRHPKKFFPTLIYLKEREAIDALE
jgi:hypothetical protein